MPVVFYIQASGEERAVEVPLGNTVMDGALDNLVPGIVGQCGGGATCSTCHCFVSSEWRARMPAPHSDELDLLAYLPTRTAASRLACQITITGELDGLRVHLPSEQV
jgi:2Fe-2S ferredoxin